MITLVLVGNNFCCFVTTKQNSHNTVGTECNERNQVSEAVPDERADVDGANCLIVIDLGPRRRPFRRAAHGMTAVQGGCAARLPPFAVCHRRPKTPTAQPRSISVANAEALALSSLKPKLDSQTPPVRLVCIAGEALGHEEFLQDYWYTFAAIYLTVRVLSRTEIACRKGELYIDEGKQTVFPVVNPTARASDPLPRCLRV